MDKSLLPNSSARLAAEAATFGYDRTIISRNLSVGIPDHSFTVIVGADQTERSKPSPDPYVAAFARLLAVTGHDLIPWRTVAIEDTKWGLVSARGADLRCVAVTNTYSQPELRADAELVVPGLHALTLAALDALCAD